jgi:hypothetical protein
VDEAETLFAEAEEQKNLASASLKLKPTVYTAFMTETDFDNNKVVPTAIYLIGCNSVINLLVLELTVLWHLQKTSI